MYDRDLSVKTEFNCHKEACDFYDMYQRGVPLDRLRADIAIPDYVREHGPRSWQPKEPRGAGSSPRHGALQGKSAGTI